jgi:protocatechuate 3,4-dioxygenase beta subunit
MRVRFTFLLFCLTFLTSTLSAQIDLQEELHAPDIGDKYIMKSIDSVDTTGINFPPPTGTNMIWDYGMYSVLNKLKYNQADSLRTDVREPSNTPYESDFPSASFTNQARGFDATGTVMHDSMSNWTYHTNWDSTWVHLGVVTPNGSVLNYDDNKELITFPFTYSDSLWDQFSGSYEFEFGGTVWDTVEIDGFNELKGVGYGTLQLPFDTFQNTLMVRNYNVQADTGKNGFVTPSKSKSTSYAWYVEHFDHWVFHLEKNVDISSAGTDTSYTATYVDPGNLPSITVSGKVLDPNGNAVTSGKVIAFEPSINQVKYEIVDVDKTLTSTGDYTINVHKGRDVILYAVPDPDNFAGLMPTFYQKADRWSKATPVVYNNSTTGEDIYTRNRPSVTSGQGNIRGKVVKGVNFAGLNKRDSRLTKGDPLANINCGVVHTGQDSIYQITTTDDSGRFEFDGLPEGNYDLRAEVPGIPVDTGGANDFNIDQDGNTHKNVRLVVDSDKITVSTNTSVNQPLTPSDEFVKVYPNPGNHVQLYLRHQEGGTANYTIQILDVTGAIVQEREKKLSTGAHKIPMQVNDVQSGIYFIKVTSSNGHSEVRKWIKP